MDDEYNSDLSDEENYHDSRGFSNSFIEDETQCNPESLYPQFPQYWVKDEIVDHCYNCKSYFSWMTRKHHCRSCGRIFCNKCSNFYIELPRNYIKFPKPIKQYMHQFKKKIAKPTKERVCLYCYDKINKLGNLFKYVKVFELLQFDLVCLNKLMLVNKNWKYAANTLLMKFREIQYYPSGQLLTDAEKSILWTNREYLLGHSHWMTILFKTVNWSNTKVAQELSSYLTKPKKCPCKKLMCIEKCHSELNIFETIDLVSNIIPNKTINKYLSFKLNTLSVTELLIYLPIIVYYIRYEYNDNNHLSKMLINKCIQSKSIQFINYLYWSLIISCEHSSYYAKYNYFLSEFNQELARHFDECFNNTIHKTFKLIHILNNIPNKSINLNIISYLKFMMKNHKMLDENNPLYIPIDCNYEIIDIIYDDVIIKNSATCPIIIPFVCRKYNEPKLQMYHIIYKNDDIRIDSIIMNMINMIDRIIKDELNIDLHIKTYKILPTKTNGGIIQIVGHSETLYNISQKRKMSILNFIMEHNPTSTVEDIRDIFIKSCAAYCVITYLLGIGDRHLDNIMVTEKGEIFHIDYSYILGKEPKILTVPKIRITPEMLDAMGGENSIGFTYFKQLVSDIYKCLRKHYNVFINMMIILADISDKYDKEYIREEIINRFLLGQTHIEAELEIETHISQSKSNHYGQNIVDFFHYHQKEQTLPSIVDYTTNIKNNVINLIWGTD